MPQARILASFSTFSRGNPPVWRALLMLVVFTANFTVFCHCAAAQKHACCCEKKEKKQPCNSARAVKFNLAEKQLADQIQAAPLPVIGLPVPQPPVQPEKAPAPTAPNTVKHPPPDLLTLQQRLLI